jgi:6-phosphogluconate dehydrogenase
MSRNGDHLMQLGMIGLGRMGSGMTERLREGGHDVRSYDPNVPERTAASLEELKEQLSTPRRYWLMVPSGEITEAVFQDVLGLAEPGDTIIDGGNSNFRDSIDRHARAKERGLHFVDVGVSGGIWGLEVGFCLMAGGDDEPVGRLAPILETLAPEDGYAHVGPSGAGHFVKMIHNGIEYGLMQAYAEGFEVMRASKEYENLDLHTIAGIWRYGSVVRSWLLELLYAAFEKEGARLEKIQGYVEDSGEGRWTIAEAIAEDVPVPVISAALYARFASRQTEGSFAAKVTAALRNQFGGHAVRAVEQAKASPDPR